MPALLSVLGVHFDNAANQDIRALWQAGGLEFATVLIYTCSAHCTRSTQDLMEELVIAQFE
jgi:hypothetical protein